MDCNIDIKQEEDPLLFIEIKTEPHDFESEIKTEAEYDDTHVKHELLSVPSVVVSNKTSSEVEKTEENLGKMLEDCENQSQNTQVNLDNFFMVACGPSEINSFGLLKEEKFDLGVNEHTEENNDIRSKIKTEVEEYEGTDIRFEQFPVHDLDTSGRTISEVQERRESFNKLSEDCEKQTQNAQVDPGKSFTAASNAVELKEEKFDVGIIKYTGENSVDNTSLFSQTADKRFMCNICCKSFTRKYYATLHLYQHTNGKRFTCSFCSKLFFNKVSFRQHTRRHSNERSFSCDICKKGFFLKRDLTGHLRTHTNERPFTCDLCNKSFTQNYSLTEHMRIHYNIKRLKCDICNGSFSKRSTLNKHLRIHSNEKPFKCNFCTKSFKAKHNLIIHIRTHNNEKPFKCDICNKTFSQKSNVNVHSRIHTNEKPYKCNICNKSFAQKSNLNTHISLHGKSKRLKNYI